MGDLVIYGSYGYTGNLITREAIDRGLDPVLAGRNRDELTDQAIKLGCESEVVALDEPKVLDMVLDDADAVIHCAGPFSRTWEPMVAACLRTGTHYLDITGELDVFEAIHERDSEARETGVMLLPGTGFDVVPTDCMAAHLADRLPEADTLELAFHAEMGVSKGTAKTMVEHIDGGGAVRRDGRIERVAVGSESREIDFGWGHDDMHAVSIPWGDVSTAYHTTGIPNVTVYMSMPPAMARQQRFAGLFAPALGFPPVQATLKWLIEQTMDGPDAEERASDPTFVWGEARTDDGDRVESRLRGPHTYDLTAATAVEITERVLDGDAPAGFQTPAGAYGPDLILAIDGVEREDVA
ncbi:saccharopine dehydrogenase NADP-binding domain-containing protein [Haloarcula sp. S1AR25-5A]|uniref:Saccharopine dehydrogenase NADP-binding domain-containing protein n=1 Tax=Haloarcula terrestris TaxID=2950533 RepID=A0AAE4EWB1_9EURY|nr:saccharopine dehydrogenase NADP-binding domain-containing protein [Haloarcula terrestris]MDS0221370.1 saccharopine dehydrogenase NADP-binding domain-containing protein [Haloarcula terrestris]